MIEFKVTTEQNLNEQQILVYLDTQTTNSDNQAVVRQHPWKKMAISDGACANFEYDDTLQIDVTSKDEDNTVTSRQVTSYPGQLLKAFRREGSSPELKNAAQSELPDHNVKEDECCIFNGTLPLTEFTCNWYVNNALVLNTQCATQHAYSTFNYVQNTLYFTAAQLISDNSSDSPPDLQKCHKYVIPSGCTMVSVEVSIENEIIKFNFTPPSS